LLVAPVCFGQEALFLSAPSFDARAASEDGEAPSNKALQMRG
jgi:hypothetical protein